MGVGGINVETAKMCGQGVYVIVVHGVKFGIAPKV